MVVAGAAFTVFLTLFIAFGSGRLGPRLVAIVVIYPFMAVWLTFSWRIAALGAYVSNAGVRLRGFVKTVTIPWDDVSDVRVGDLTIPGWGSSMTGAKSIWIERRSGPAVQTPLNNKSAEFLGRRRVFDLALARLQDGRDEAKRHPT